MIPGPAVFNIFGDESAENAQMLQRLLESAGEMLPEHIVNMTNSILYAVQSYWASQAIDEGGGWGRRYAGVLMVEPVPKGGGKGSVYADDSNPDYMFVLMVENGVRSWSIKDALLASDKVRYKKEAPHRLRTYIVVPFRWRTPQGSTGNKAQASSNFAGVMPEEAHETALRGGVVSEQQARALKKVNLAGLKRFGEAGHGHYLTFRVVHEDSPGWQYPDIPAAPVYERVRARVEGAIAKGIAGYVKRFAEELEKEHE